MLGNNIKYTFDEARNELFNVGYELLSKVYEGILIPLILKDKFGYIYHSSLYNMRYEKPSKFHKSNPYTIQNIKLWCKLNNKPFELISNEYCGEPKKLRWKCQKVGCQEIFESSWKLIRKGCGCGFCHGNKVGLSNCLSARNPKLISEWNYSKNIKNPTEYVSNSFEKVWWQCKNGHEWEASISSRNNGSGCPYCAGRKVNLSNCLATKNPELSKEWHPTKNEDLTPYEVTCGSGKKVWWKCNECGHEWISTIASRNYKVGCPQCSESHGEKRIKRYLNYINEDYVWHKEFNNLIGMRGGNLSYDFYLLNYDLLIEYQGQFHDGTVGYQTKQEFIQQKKHDERKKTYAIENGINLLEIWYWDFDNIEEILKKTLADRGDNICVS